MIEDTKLVILFEENGEEVARASVDAVEVVSTIKDRLAVARLLLSMLDTLCEGVLGEDD